MNRQLLVPGSVEWLKARQSIICASEISAFLGVDPNRSRAASIREKFHLAPPMNHVAEQMCDVGKAYEPVALHLLQSYMRYPLIDMGSLRHAGLGIFEGRPDSVTIDPDTACWIPVEVKTRAYPNPFDSVPYESIFDVPYKHWIQLQCYMVLLNSPFGYLCSYSPNHGMKVNL
jgi:hypothetical protein